MNPSKVVPVTEYVVVDVGLTVNVKLEPRPTVQLKVVPVISELADSSEHSTIPIKAADTQDIIGGKG